MASKGGILSIMLLTKTACIILSSIYAKKESTQFLLSAVGNGVG